MPKGSFARIQTLDLPAHVAQAMQKFQAPINVMMSMVAEEKEAAEPQPLEQSSFAQAIHSVIGKKKS